MTNRPASFAIVVTVALLAPPWSSQPPAHVQGEWGKGDHFGWQKQLRAPNSAQNENSRIGR